jgi:hypothetical protein
MKTDRLISAIVQDVAQRRPSMASRLALALTAGGVISIGLFALMLGPRPDIGGALQTWRFATKLLITASVFAAALWATAELARPDANNRRARLALAVPVAFLGLALGCELLVSPAASWSERAIGNNSRLCLTSVTLLSMAPLMALLWGLRAGAPRSPTMAGAAAGVLAGGLGATLYAIHCVDDSALFVALWYVPPVALVTLTGTLLGSRVLQW